jgi:hypothetical protein
VRAEGGITQVWTSLGGSHIDLREIDYAEALRERPEGEAADWDRVVACCLQGESLDLNDDMMRTLLRAAGRVEQLEELVTAVEKAAEGRGMGARSAAVLKLLRGIVDAISKADPDQLETTLRNMASAMGQMAACSRSASGPASAGRFARCRWWPTCRARSAQRWAWLMTCPRPMAATC